MSAFGIIAAASKRPGGGGGGTVPTSGLQLWLSDTGSDPSTWPDISGNGRDATQATSSKQPVIVPAALAGHQTRRFDGVDDILVTPSLNAQTVFVVATSSFSSFPSMAGAVAQSGFVFWALGLGNSNILDNFDIAGEMRIDGAVSNVFLPAASSRLVSYVATGSYSGQVAVGAWATDANGSFWTGDIAEVVIYDRALSSIERQGVELYLSSKYGITLAA